jgi:hypothetical protein
VEIEVAAAIFALAFRVVIERAQRKGDFPRSREATAVIAALPGHYSIGVGSRASRSSDS